jgi:hypothetical protein
VNAWRVSITLVNSSTVSKPAVLVVAERGLCFSNPETVVAPEPFLMMSAGKRLIRPSDVLR